MTPLNQMCMDQIELHTTAKKSDHIHSGVKSRPKDKGLRKLSQKAFEAVQELKNATYKEVATRLVSQLNEEEFEGQVNNILLRIKKNKTSREESMMH